MVSPEVSEGYDAYWIHNKRITDNPYSDWDEPQRSDDWAYGWNLAWIDRNEK